MGQSREGKEPSWGAWKIFLWWTAPVYVLPLLSFAFPQWSVLRSWRYHLTFLIPAVIVGGAGTLFLANRSSDGWLRDAVRGAAVGLAASALGAALCCGALMAPGSAASEGSAWYGILQVPGIFFATVTGFVIGMNYSHEE
jgi:predicted permease